MMSPRQPTASPSAAAPLLTVDHVSIAVPRIADTLAFFRRCFPVEMRAETQPGYSQDFNWCDFHVGHFKFELIEPAVPGEGFVSRFLSRRGPGLHHWSLETTRLAPVLERLEADGARIVDRFEGADGSKTAFVSPRSAYGVLIQFWQVPALDAPERPPAATHRLRSGERVRMRVDHISIAVRDIDSALRFFQRHLPFQLRRAAHPGWDGSFLIANFFVNGYKVELIQNAPGRPGGFVDRFIERRGEGLHHISLDVDRLDPYLAELEADGVRIVDRETLGNGHKTAFISPRSAHGVLFQFWESPEDWPTSQA